MKPAKVPKGRGGKVAAERSTHRTLKLDDAGRILGIPELTLREHHHERSRVRRAARGVRVPPGQDQSLKSASRALRAGRISIRLGRLGGVSSTANGAGRRPGREPWTNPTTRRRSPRSRGISAICTPTSEVRLGDDRRARRRRPPRVHIFAPIHRQRQPLVPPRRTTLTKPTPSRALSSVSRDATDEDIKRAYRTLAQVAHPDKHASPALREVRPGATPRRGPQMGVPTPVRSPHRLAGARRPRLTSPPTSLRAGRLA